MIQKNKRHMQGKGLKVASANRPKLGAPVLQGGQVSYIRAFGQTIDI
jgi:hypothetical protein